MLSKKSKALNRLKKKRIMLDLKTIALLRKATEANCKSNTAVEKLIC